MPCFNFRPATTPEDCDRCAVRHFPIDPEDCEQCNLDGYSEEDRLADKGDAQCHERMGV